MHLLTLILAFAAVTALSAAMVGAEGRRRRSLQPARVRRSRPRAF